MSKIEIAPASELETAYAGPNGDGEYAAYTHADWRECVAGGNTLEGYWEWVHLMLSEEASAEADMGESGDSPTPPSIAVGTGSPSAKPSRSESRVILIISEQLGHSKGDILRDKRLDEDLGADSLDLIELVMATEDEFEFEISDEDAEKIRTVGDAIDYVARRLGEL